MIELRPLHEYVWKLHKDGVSWEELAAYCGYKKVSDFKRALGFEVYHSRGKDYLKKKIKRNTAERFMRALGLDPIDIGL